MASPNADSAPVDLVRLCQVIADRPSKREPKEVGRNLPRSKERLPAVASDAAEAVQAKIHVVRGIRVMLAADLAELYGVSTSALNQAVERNPARFPEDFAFRLTAEEAERLRSQIVISVRGRGGRRTAPRAFTEQGVAMLSSVLHSPRAIAMNVLIMRTFVRLRQAQSDYADLRRRLEELEERIGTELTDIWRVLDALENPPVPPRRPLGFRPETTP
jgi:hypothetical protein